jgi:hypothetical protein
MNRKLAALAGVAALAACAGDGNNQFAAPGDKFVFEARGSIQCEFDGITPAASAQKLIDAGIDVLSSTCGIRTGVAFPTVCGGATGEIVVHEIRAANVEDAVPLGFAEVATLVDVASGASYALIDCADRTPITPTIE